ncbi:MAG TPA: glycosyltransferase [bacterium]|nr:glycosyltransferase [bacterium]
MRILQVIHRYPRTHGAGSENYTRQICCELSKRHTVAVVTRGSGFFDGPFGELFPANGYPHPVYRYFRHPRDTGIPEREYWNPGLDDAFQRFIHSWKPDIIHFQHAVELSISLIHAAARLRCPILFTLHDFWTLCPGILMLNHRGRICEPKMTPDACRWCMFRSFHAPRILASGQSLYRIRRERMREALNRCDRILCPSMTLKTLVEDTDVPSERLIHWPFGINLEFSGTPKTPTDVIHHPIQFGYTGTLAHQKGVDILLQAFLSLPPDLISRAELTVHGDDTADPSIQRRVRHWKQTFNTPSIRFAGGYSPSDIERIHQSLDVAIVPSIWLENRPLTILEAFAAGNPVVGSRIGGIEEMLQTGGGWLFAPGSPDALRDVLSNIIQSPDTIGLCRKSIPVVPGVAEECQRLEQIYSECISGKTAIS